MPILPTIPTLEGLSYPVKKLLGFAAKNSMQAQGKSEKEILRDLVTGDNPSFYSWQTRDGGNEIDTYLYGIPYNTENTSNIGPSYENYLSTNFPLRKHAVKTYDTHFGDTLYIDQKYKDQVLDELEQGKTVGASMGRYAHAPSYIVNTKDDEKRPYDAGGHLMQFQYDKDGNVVANMSDIYDFLPRDFEEKYGAIKEYGPLKTAGMYAMHYVGTPFIVRQNGIPVRFKEIVPKYKTELQSQLGEFLSNWGDMYDLTIPHRLTDEQIEEIFDGKQSGDEVLDFMEQKGYLTPVFKKGGRIHIKKKNRGKFTAAAKRAGMGVQEFARHVLSNKDKYSSTLVKRANFARNSKKFKHENGGILKAQEGTGNGFWSKLWNAVKAGGMAARDAKLGAVGAQQVRDLYSEGKNQEAQDLAKQYAKANTTGIALAGGAASTGLLGDLMVTGATTAADTFIDGDVDNFGKNLAKNVTGDLIGRKIEKYIKPVGDLFESSMFKLFEDPGTIYITNGKSGILKTNPSKYTQRLLNGGSKRTDVSKDFAKKINELEPTVLIRFDETGKRLPIQDFRFWRKRPDFIYPEVPNGTISIPDNSTTLMESIGDVYDINTGKLTSKTNYIRDLNRKLTDEEFSILTDHEIAHLIDRTSNRNLGDVDFISGNYISDPSEIHARISQAKSAANITDGSKKFTGEGYRKMFWDYITSGKVDNQMSKFYVNVKDWNKLANWANKFVPGIGTTIMINQQSK